MYSYFDPIGFDCLTRRERREFEMNIIELEEQLAIEEVNDEADVSQKQSQISIQTKSSIITKFLNSIGKTFVAPSSSSVITPNKKKLIEEMSVYRSLAQREYNSIVNDEKCSNVVSFMKLFFILQSTIFFDLIDAILEYTSSSIEAFIQICCSSSCYSSNFCRIRKRF